jgi:hypothetical protein
MRCISILIGSLMLAASASAAEFFVAPNGTPQGDGSKDKPWDIHTALKQPAAVKPGDTIWVRGGTYRGGFDCKLTGTEKQPIIVRNYQGEHATLDVKTSSGGPIINGGYTIYWGLEAMDSYSNRHPDGGSADGVCVYGPGTKCINMVVHDTAQGFSAFNASPDSEYYGNLSYYNGNFGKDRNHGHGIYMQNIKGLKHIIDNYVGDNACEGMQIYGSHNANVEGFRIDGNIIANNGWDQFQDAFIVASGNTRRDLVITNNYSYIGYERAEGTATFGKWTPGDDIVIKDNVFAGGGITAAVYYQAGPVTYTGNKIVTNPKAVSCQWLYILQNHTKDKYTWDKNEYWGYGDSKFGYAPKAVAGVDAGRSSCDWDGWKKATGFDANSTFHPEQPTGVWQYVRPNKYEKGRAHIAVYNWDKKDKVDVDISKSGLADGDAYEVRDLQNFYGKPVAEGKYDGKAVSLPMTGLAKAAGLGFKSGLHTAPAFGTFIVLKAGAIK